jgi:hypothetical protein
VQKTELCVDYRGVNLEIPHITSFFAQKGLFYSF